MNRLLVFFLFSTLFWGPWLFAWYWNTHPNAWSFQTMNKGTLLQPTLALESTDPSLTERWSLLYLPAVATCDAECKRDLAQVSNVIKALGKESPRVQTRIASELQWKPPVAAALQQLSEKAKWAIVDPHAEVVLYYPGSFSDQALLKDLKRLLYVSQIG